MNDNHSFPPSTQSVVGVKTDAAASHFVAPSGTPSARNTEILAALGRQNAGSRSASPAAPSVSGPLDASRQIELPLDHRERDVVEPESKRRSDSQIEEGDGRVLSADSSTLVDGGGQPVFASGAPVWTGDGPYAGTSIPGLSAPILASAGSAGAGSAEASSAGVFSSSTGVVLLGALFGGLLLGAGGGSDRPKVDTGDDGTVIDGYLAGAKVSRVNDPSKFVFTNADGKFSGLTGTGPIRVDGVAEGNNGLGTIDRSTGQAFRGVLFAPDGSDVVTPLTTLIQLRIDTGATQEQAVQQVRASLGLDASFNLLTSDPIAAFTQSQSAVALDVMKAGIQLATLLQALSDDSVEFGELARSVADRVGTGQPLNLADVSFIDFLAIRAEAQVNVQDLSSRLTALDAATSLARIELEQGDLLARYRGFESEKDVVRPDIAVTTTRSSLAANQTATITFTLTEASADFSESDVSVTGGALSNFSGSGALYTATFTPLRDSTASASISVGSGVFTDLAGNVNADGAETNNAVSIAVDTVAPRLTSIQVDRPTGQITLHFDDFLALTGSNLDPSQFVVRAFDATSLSQVDLLVQSVAVAEGTNALILTLSNSLDADGNIDNIQVGFQPSQSVGAVRLTDLVGNAVEGFGPGTASDGLIRGAEIWIEYADAGGLKTENTGLVTNDQGDFFLPDRYLSAPYNSGALIIRGGVNIDTGIPNTLDMRVPIGVSAVTPFTALSEAVNQYLDAVFDAGISIDGADAEVLARLGDIGINNADAISSTLLGSLMAKAFGLPEAADLTRITPQSFGMVSSSASPPEALLRLQKVATQIAAISAKAEDIGVVDGLAPGQATKLIFVGLAKQIVVAGLSGQTLDLSDPTVLQNAFSDLSASAVALAGVADTTASIAGSSSFGSVGTVQSQYFDAIDPAAPLAVEVVGSSPDVAEGSRVIGSPTPRFVLGLNTASVDGTAAVVGDTVVLLRNDTQVASAVLTAADLAASAVELTVANALPDGQAIFSAIVVDRAGRVSQRAASPEVSLRIDTQAPPTPDIAAVTSDNVINAAEQSAGVVIAGTAEPGSRLTLQFADRTVGGVLTDDQGRWVHTLSSADVTAMGQGDALITAAATDRAGNTSSLSARPIGVDTLAPSARATRLSLADGSGEALAAGTVTAEQQPVLAIELSRPLAQGETAVVFDGGTRLGIALPLPTSATGLDYQFIPQALPNGNHVFTVRVFDVAGNAFAAPESLAFGINADTPASVVDLQKGPGQTVSLVYRLPEGDATVDGDSVVLRLERPADGAVFSAVVPVVQGASQQVDLTSLPAFEAAVAVESDYVLSAQVRNNAGTVGSVGSPLEFSVDLTAPSVSISDNTTGVASSAVQYTFDFSEPVVGFDSSKISVLGGTPSNFVAVSATRYTIVVNPSSGSVAPILVSVVDGGAIDEAGNPVALIQAAAQAVDTLAPAAPSVNPVAGGDGINAQDRRDGVALSGITEPGATITLTFSVPGKATRVINFKADALTGQWSHTLSAADYFYIGTQAALTVQAADGLGNLSEASEPITLRVDTIAPVLSPLNLVQAQQLGVGLPATNALRPEVSLTTEANVDLQIDWNGDRVFDDVVVVGDSPLVNLIAPSGLLTKDGVYSMSVVAKDSVGNTTERKLSYFFDSSAPTAESISLAASSGGGGKLLTLRFSEPVPASLALSDLTLGRADANFGSGASLTPIGAADGRARAFLLTLGTGFSLGEGDQILVDNLRLADALGNVPPADLAFTVPSGDGMGPKASISVDTASLASSGTARVLITFDEPVSGFSLDDLSLSPANSGSFGTLVKSATVPNAFEVAFVAARNVQGQVVISLKDGSFGDRVGNVFVLAESASPSVVFQLDTQAPTLSISSSRSNLKADETAVITLTLSEPVPSLPSVSVSGGASLSAWSPVAQSSGSQFTATLSPPANQVGTVSFTVGSWADAAGNSGRVSARPVVAFDTDFPKILAVESSVTGIVNLSVSELSYTFRFSKPVAGLDADSFSLTNAQVVSGGVSSSDNGRVWQVRVQPAAGVAEGSVNIALKAGEAIDSAGNGNPYYAHSPLAIDTLAPGAGVVIDNDAPTVTSNQVTLAGSISAPLSAGERLVVVELSGDSERLLGTVKPEGTTWEFKTPALSNGEAELSVRVQDAAGNRGSSATYTVTVAASAPATTVQIDDALRLSNDSTPTLSGSLSAPLTEGQVVDVFESGGRIGSASVSGLRWSFTPNQAFAEGARSFSAAVQGTGGTGPVSAPYLLGIDLTAPVVSITDNVTGTAVGPVIYSFNFSEPVTGFNASQVDVSGGMKGAFSAISQTRYTLTVQPDANSVAPIGVSVRPDIVRDAAGNVIAKTDATPQPADTQAPSLPEFAANIPAAINRAELAGGLSLSGTAEVNSSVRLTLGALSRTVQAGVDGVWITSIGATDLVSVGQGNLTLKAVAVDALGNASGVATRSIIIDTLAPQAPSEMNLAPIEITPGQPNDSGAIGDRITNNDLPVLRVRLRGDTAVGDTVQFFETQDFSATGALLPSAEPVLSAMVTSSDRTLGYVDLVVDGEPLEDGTYQVRVRFVDQTGNAGEFSPVARFTLDTQAPQSPAISSIASNDGPATSRITADSTPVIQLSAEAGVRLVLGREGVPVAGSSYSVVEVSPGDYRATVSTALTDGFYGFVAVDAAGNRSDPPSGFQSPAVFRVDTLAPSAPAVAAIGDILSDNLLNAEESAGFRVSVALPASGQGVSLAEAGDRLELWVAGAQSPFSAKVLTSEDLVTGPMAFDVPASALGTDGPKSIVARLVDRAGNVGALSSAVAFILDDTAPTSSTADLDVPENSTDPFVQLNALLSSEPVTWSLDNPDDPNFVLQGGGIRLRAPANFEQTSQPTLNLVLRMTDQAGNVANHEIAITVRDENDAPQPVGAIGKQVAVNGKDFDLPLNPYFKDVDAGEQAALTYEVVSGSLPEGLRLQGGAIVGKASLDADAATLTVRATDPRGLFAEQTFSLSVVSAPSVTGFTLVDLNGDDVNAGKKDDQLSITLLMSEPLEVTASSGVLPTIQADFRFGETGPTITADYVHSSSRFLLSEGQLRFEAVAPNGDANSVTLTAIRIGPGTMVSGVNSGQAWATSVVNQNYTGYRLDNTAPTATLVVNDDALKVGDTATVTVTFSEPVPGFDAMTDLTVVGGTLSGISTSDGGITWTGTLTPESDLSLAVGRITLKAGYEDRAGNLGAVAQSNSFAVDTQPPTTTISLSKAALKLGDTAVLTIDFSEAPLGFDPLPDLTLPVGSVLSNGSFDNSGRIYTATLTPGAERDFVTAQIFLNTVWTDAAGNTPLDSKSSDEFNIDTRSPGIDLSTALLTLTEPTALLSGSTEPFATVQVSRNNAPIHGLSITADQDGDWSVSAEQLGVVEVNSAGVFSFKATDRVGNVGEAESRLIARIGAVEQAATEADIDRSSFNVADTIRVGSGDGYYALGGGDDVLIGLVPGDPGYAQSGDNVFEGGDGNDRFVHISGDDVFIGGQGQDAALFAGTSSEGGFTYALATPETQELLQALHGTQSSFLRVESAATGAFYLAEVEYLEFAGDGVRIDLQSMYGTASQGVI